jgi:hypothetical protein
MMGSNLCWGGIRLRIWLVPDLFGKIRVLERVMAFLCTIFSASDKIGFLVEAESAKLKTSVLYLRMRFCTDSSLEMADF